MTEIILSNDELDEFRSTPKQVTDPKSRWTEKPGRHKQRNHIAESVDGTQFRLYLRQNLDDESDFSCGLALIRKGGKPLSLVRYNGSSHAHGDILYRCHIHRATADALLAGKKIDSHAEESNRYKSLEGALACLIDDCHIEGLKAEHDQRDLLDEY